MVAWKLWTSVPHVALWEAVALLLEIEPGSLKHHRDGWMAGPGRGPTFEPRSFPSREKLQRFDVALGFAERAANVAGPIHLRIELASGMNKRKAQVSLPEVVAFFVSVEWPNVPPPLLALVSSGVLVSQAADKVYAAAATPATLAAPPASSADASIKPAPAAAAVVVRHSTKEPERRDDLWPAIDEARGLAANPNDTADVWAHLSVLARAKRAPLLGAIEVGLQFAKGCEVEILTRDALAARLKRYPANPR